MKKFCLNFLCVLFCLAFVGCAEETQLRVAHIYDNTTALSTNYSIKVVLDEDERVEKRYVDVQVMSSEAEQTLSVGEENQEKTDLFLEKADYWYNLTYLFAQAGGTDENEYVTYKDFGSKIYNLTSQNDVKLKFRVVAGKIKTNEETGENILVLSEDISDEFSLDVKKFEE